MIHGTRAVLAVLKDKQDRARQWLQEMIVRRGYKRTAIVLATKNICIVWAILNRDESYRLTPVGAA